MADRQDLRLLIFDFDGTLFDLNVDWGQLRVDLMLHGSQVKLGDEIERYKISGDDRLQVVARREMAAANGRHLDSSVERMLNELSTGYHIAIFSRNSRQSIEEVMRNSVLERAPHIVAREDTSRLKPDPEGLTAILTHFSVSPRHALVIGDTFHDIEAAKRAGIASLIVRNNRNHFIPDGADAYIESLENLIDTITLFTGEDM